MSGSKFLDTSGLVALLNTDDWLHEPAARWFRQLGHARVPLVTTNLVLAELGNTLSRGTHRRRVTSFIDALRREPLAQIAHVSEDLFLRGLQRFATHVDKEWGLVDCVRFELMHEAGIQEAFTADHHFEQAGFTAMLR